MGVLCILVGMVTVTIIRRKRHDANSQSKLYETLKFTILFLGNTADSISTTLLDEKITEENCAYKLNEFGAQADTRHTAAYHPIYTDVYNS